MKQVKIKIEQNTNSILSIKEIKYVFETIFTIMGVPCHYLADNTGNSHANIYYGNEPTKNADLIIRRNTNSNKIDTSKIRFIKENDTVFFDFNNYSSKILQLEDSSKPVEIRNDIIFTIFYLLTGQNEKEMKRDRWDRHEIEDSILYQQCLLHSPIVDQYIILIRQFVEHKFDMVAKWPDKKKVAVILSHDTDYPEMIRFLEVLRYMYQRRNIDLKTIWQIMSGKESFWKFKEWMAIEQQFNTKSAFYFCPFGGNLFRYLLIAPDPFYDVSEKKFRDVAGLIQSKGFEVGLHSSFCAYKSLKMFKSEKEMLEKAFAVPIFGNRHHYWHLNMDKPYETALIHQQIGLLYDSSIAFERHSGFRYSVCSPFHLFDQSKQESLSILQFPPTLMDDHLFGHASRSKFHTYQEHIDSLVNAIYKYEGIFVVDFHTRVLNNTFYPEWGNAYKYLLEKLTQNQDFYNATPKEVAKYWKERSDSIKKHSIDETSYIHK